VSEKPPVRERLAQDFAARYERLLALIDDAMEKQRKQRVEVQCKHCLKSGVHYVDVLDVKSALAAAEFAANQSFGRPGVADDPEAAATHVYQLIWKVPCKHSECQSTERQRSRRELEREQEPEAEEASATEAALVAADEVSADGPLAPPRSPDSLVDIDTYSEQLRTSRKRQSKRPR
jgi:hypothetical protein